MMKAFVLKASGTMLLLSLCEAALPSGPMRAAAKRVFALVRIAILAEPVIGFITGAAQ